MSISHCWFHKYFGAPPRSTSVNPGIPLGILIVHEQPWPKHMGWLWIAYCLQRLNWPEALSSFWCSISIFPRSFREEDEARKNMLGYLNLNKAVILYKNYVWSKNHLFRYLLPKMFSYVLHLILLIHWYTNILFIIIAVAYIFLWVNY